MDMSYAQDVYMSNGTEYNQQAQHCNVVALYIDGCLGFHDILVYWNESMLHNFRTSNYVQQRKTYMRKAATVHLNCSTVPCNTLCARMAAAVWHKTCDIICDLQSARPWDAVPWCKTYPCQYIYIYKFSMPAYNITFHIVYVHWIQPPFYTHNNSSVLALIMTWILIKEVVQLFSIYSCWCNYKLQVSLFLKQIII
jgi:hypothetical protein